MVGDCKEHLSLGLPIFHNSSHKFHFIFNLRYTSQNLPWSYNFPNRSLNLPYLSNFSEMFIIFIRFQILPAQSSLDSKFPKHFPQSPLDLQSPYSSHNLPHIPNLSTTSLDSQLSQVVQQTSLDPNLPSSSDNLL